MKAVVRVSFWWLGALGRWAYRWPGIIQWDPSWSTPRYLYCAQLGPRTGSGPNDSRRHVTLRRALLIAWFKSGWCCLCSWAVFPQFRWNQRRDKTALHEGGPVGGTVWWTGVGLSALTAQNRACVWRYRRLEPYWITAPYRDVRLGRNFSVGFWRENACRSLSANG